MGLMTAQTTNDLSIMIGGDAGQGVESSGAGFPLALARLVLAPVGVISIHMPDSIQQIYADS